MPLFTLLKDLQPHTSKWVIKTRCVRAYEVSAGSNKANISSLDCVLEDKEVCIEIYRFTASLSVIRYSNFYIFLLQGTQIHASFPRDIMHKFKDQIKENKVLCIRNFFVNRNRVTNRVTTNEHRLFMNTKTEVLEVEDLKFPEHVFQFNNFKEVAEIKRIDKEPLFGRIPFTFRDFC